MKLRAVLFAIATAANLFCASTIAQSPFQVNFEAFRKTVVFIYAQKPDGTLEPDGTGFLVAIPSKSHPDRSFIILVTARHMVDASWTGCPVGNLFARFNKKIFDPTKDEAGTVDFLLPSGTTGDSKWITPKDDTADIAYTILNAPMLGSAGLDFNAVTLDEIAKPDDV